MKNKFFKILSTNICCVMFSILIPTYVPQDNKIVLSTISAHETSISVYQIIDLPYPHAKP